MSNGAGRAGRWGQTHLILTRLVPRLIIDVLVGDLGGLEFSILPH